MQTDFKEEKVVQRTPIIELNGVYPFSELRDEKQVSNSGAVTDADSEFRVRHAASGDFARLASASRGRYQPGNSAEMGIGVRFDAVPSDGDFTSYWGYFDMETDANDNNKETIKEGYVFGVDRKGKFIEIIKNGTSQKKVYRKDWNGDYSADFDLTDGHIFQVEYVYYGYGAIVFKMLKTSKFGKRETKTAHVEQFNGQTSLDNSNLQVGGLVKSTNTSTDFSMYVGGRQYSIVGDYRPRKRVNSEYAAGSVTTSGFTPIVSFRRKASRRETAINVAGFDVTADTDQILEIRVKGALSGASFADLSNQDASETSLEADTSATAVDTNTGVQIYQKFLTGGAGVNADVSDITDIFTDVPDEANITFSSQALNTDGNIRINPRIDEIY